jgi:hypothetical protein
VQRSVSAPSESDAVQGHGTSQGQFSKYLPSSFHAISVPPLDMNGAVAMLVDRTPVVNSWCEPQALRA